jgi:PadR family transcriptional regulator, regulatory protein AphA
MSAAVGPRGRVSAKYALLGLLRERPAYGYQLGERLRERLGPAWAINSGHLYQTLKRMEKEGLIERVDGAEHDRDDRHVYAITDGGEAEFQSWFEQDVGSLQLLRRPLLVKIALAGPERLEDALKQIDAYERGCADRLKELSRERDETSDESLQVRADHILLRLGLSADISHLKAELGWARHARQMVSWLLNQDAVWPGTRRRTSSSPEEARDRQSAREELFGRISRRRLRPTRDESDRDHDA